MTESAGAGVAQPRAFLRVGGITLARHQLGVALAMDCQRVICIAREVMPDLIALQHDAERAGIRFHIVSGSRGLAGLVTANDDILSLSDGLMADPQEAAVLLEPGHVVLVQPVEAGVAAGYERIDLNHAAAGAFRIPGRLVERLLELPADCDVPSALTRIALQAGVAMREVPAAARNGARWRLVRDEGEAHAAESDWLRLHLGARRSRTPVVLLSRLGLKAIGPSLLHAGNGSKVTFAAALAVLLLSLGAGWFGLTLVGLLFGVVAAVLGEGAAMLRRIECSSLGLPPSSLTVERAMAGLIDLTLVALVVWSAALPPDGSLLDRAFPPLILIALVRLLPRMVDPAWAHWIEDRVLLAGLLALALAAEALMSGVQVLALVLVAVGLLFPGGKLRLT